MNPKFSIGLVLFETKFLEYSLSSLFTQNFENVEFLIRDHSPDFEASKSIEEKLPEVASRSKIFRGKNLFHSGGMNFLINQSKGEYFVAASSDALYDPDFLVKAAEILDKPENQKVGALGGKLKRWDFTKNEKLETLDSIGIGVKKTGKFFEIGSGENSDKFSEEKIVFGISGALVILRKSALDIVAQNDEFFDKKLHFKNDVDLAFRLNWLGWQAKFSPEIIAWHARGLGKLKSRNERSSFEKENSTFGQFAVWEKNWDSNFSEPVKFSIKMRLLLIRLFGIFSKAEKNGIRKFEQIRGELEKSRRNIPARELEKLFE